jgi:hypothetical protein
MYACMPCVHIPSWIFVFVYMLNATTYNWLLSSTIFSCFDLVGILLLQSLIICMGFLRKKSFHLENFHILVLIWTKSIVSSSIYDVGICLSIDFGVILWHFPFICKPFANIQKVDLEFVKGPKFFIQVSSCIKSIIDYWWFKLGCLMNELIS